MRDGFASGRIAVIDELMTGREKAAVGAPKLGGLIVEAAIEDAGISCPEHGIWAKLCQVCFRRVKIGCQGDRSERHHSLPDVDDPSEENVGKSGEPDEVQWARRVRCNP